MAWVQSAPGQWQWTGPGQPTSPKPGSGGGSGGQNWYNWLRGQGGEGNPYSTGGGGGFTSGSGQAGYNPYGSGGEFGGFDGMPPEARESLDMARKRLAGGYMGSTFGQTAQSRYMKPYGLSPEARRGLEVEAEERLAGRLANTKDNARLYANARGALDSGGLANLMGQIETGTARDLNHEMTNIGVQDEQMAMEREFGSADILSSLMGLEHSSNLAAAQFEAGIQWPLGGSGGSGAQPWVEQGEPPLLNQRGEIDFTKLYGMGGDKDWLMTIARKQREKYERWKQSAAGGGY